MQSRRQPDTRDLGRYVLIKPQSAQRNTARAIGIQQAAEHQNCRNVLRNYRAQRDTLHGHAEPKYENKVQPDVQRSGTGNIIKRALGVAVRAEDRRAEVIDHRSGNAQKDDAHILQSCIVDLGRCIHPTEDRSREQKSGNRKATAANQRQRDRRMHSFLDPAVIARAVKPRDHEVDTGRKPGKQHHDQAGDRIGRTDRRQRRIADASAHDGEIGRAEQQLQDARKNKRQRKAQDIFHQRPAAHIDFISFFCHIRFLRDSLRIFCPLFSDTDFTIQVFRQSKHRTSGIVRFYKFCPPNSGKGAFSFGNLRQITTSAIASINAVVAQPTG